MKNTTGYLLDFRIFRQSMHSNGVEEPVSPLLVCFLSLVKQADHISLDQPVDFSYVVWVLALCMFGPSDAVLRDRYPEVTLMWGFLHFKYIDEYQSTNSSAGTLVRRFFSLLLLHINLKDSWLRKTNGVIWFKFLLG